MALSPDGSLLVAAGTDGRAVFLDYRRGIVVRHLTLKQAPSQLSFSPNGRLLLVLLGRVLQVWRMPADPALLHDYGAHGLDLVFSLAPHSDAIRTVQWSPCSRFLLTASADMTARVLRLSEQTGGAVKDHVPPVLACHRHPLMGAFFGENGEDDQGLVIYTMAQDGSLGEWLFDPNTANAQLRGRKQLVLSAGGQQALEKENRAFVRDWAYSPESAVLLVAYDNGCFALYRPHDPAPELALPPLYSLSLGAVAQVDAVALSADGQWLAFGSASLGQLLVWEWRSEAYVLRQQGLLETPVCCAWSPDGTMLATGGSSGTVRVWSTLMGGCVATFVDHGAGVTVTAVEWARWGGRLLVSAGSDGTVRAYDLVRQRQFRVLVTPTPMPLGCVAIDAAGELVVAAPSTADPATFPLYVWSLQTGQLLEELAGHTGPVSALAFSPTGGSLLVSGSWDGTVRCWNIYARDHAPLTLTQDGSEVVALSLRPDGLELAVATRRGSLLLWDPIEGSQVKQVDCRRDFADRPLSPHTISSLSYLADGRRLLVAGSWPWAGLWDAVSGHLLRQFAISSLHSTDDRRRMLREAGVEESAQRRQSIRTVRANPAGGSWAALCPEGLLIWSVESARLGFDPLDLALEVTPEACRRALEPEQDDPFAALIIALRLNLPAEQDLVFASLPVERVDLVLRRLPPKYLASLLAMLARLAESNRFDYQRVLQWVRSLLQHHCLLLRRSPATGQAAAPLRILTRATGLLKLQLTRLFDDTLLRLDHLLE